MAQNGGLRRLRHAPEQSAERDGRGDAHIVAQIGEVEAQQLAEAHFQLFVDEEDVDEDDNELHDTAHERGDRGADNAELRRAEIAVNEAVVQADVDADGAETHHGADCGGLDALKGIHKRVGDGENEVSPADDAQIARTLSDDGVVVREKGQNAGRQRLGEREEHDADEEAGLDADVDDLLDRPRAALTPVLGGEDDDAEPDARRDLLERELELVDERRAGEGELRVAAEHDVVGKVDRERGELLEHDDEKQGKKRAVKAFISREDAEHLRVAVRRDGRVASFHGRGGSFPGVCGHRNRPAAARAAVEALNRA